MYRNEFFELLDNQDTNREYPPGNIDCKIISEYLHTYARTSETSREIVHHLSHKYPYNVCAALQPIIDLNRE